MKVSICVAALAAALVNGGCKKESSPAPQAAEARDKAAAKTLSPADMAGMRGTLEAIVSSAVRADLKEAVSHFTSVDEQRVQTSNLVLTYLKAESQKFNDAWQARYGEPFSIDKEKVFAADFATLAANDSANAAAKTGTATLKAAGMPPLVAPLVAESGNWRLDIADELANTFVLGSVTGALQELNAGMGAWPADKLQATRVVARRMMAALLPPMSEE